MVWVGAGPDCGPSRASGLIARCSFSLSSQGDLGQTKSAFVRALFSFFHDFFTGIQLALLNWVRPVVATML